MNRFPTGLVLAAFAALSVCKGAQAQIAVERSGNVFHVAACAAATAGFARCHARIVTDAAGNAIQSTGPAINGYAPADLRNAYKIRKNGAPSTVVAIVAAFGYNSAEADLGVYRAQWGLPACTTANGCFRKLNQNGQQGGYPAQNVGWAQESALDLDMASAMCPNCQIWLIEANDNSFGNLGVAVNTAAALGAHAVANSYGGAERGTRAFESAYNHLGVAITASTGDGGFNTGPQFPASSPHVTAVGGTHLERDGSERGWAETAWGSSGSGCSTVYAKPKWQSDPLCSKRTVADVAAVADPATGVAVYGPVNGSQSNWLVFGGTSIGAPLIAGVYGVNGEKVKYGSNPYRHTDDLFDITSGSGGSCGSYLCNAGPGYDGPTGWGTPDGTRAF